MTTAQSPSRDQRIVRVFISSTFRDMQAEREELVKFTFPELRRRCRGRRVEFVGVDLRWGITNEQRAEGKVLPICLAEIEGCRPYFIGLLGERYGWVPHGMDDELVKREPWLAEHRDKSVTELEILHGVLNEPDMKGLAFFYFRSKETSDAIEQALSQEPDYRPESEASRAQLNILKQRIETSACPLRKDYPDAKTLGQLVLDDLWVAMDERYPIGEVPTELEQRRIGHDAFAYQRRKVYIGRDEYFDTLNSHAQGDGPPLVILGQSGSGKSALLANWAYMYRQQHPDAFIVSHYIGSTTDSADYLHILRRIMEEIRDAYAPETTQEHDASSIGVDDDRVPTDARKIVEGFPLWLRRAAARGRCILILDALNQLDDRDNAPDMGWLPAYFPPNVRVILSTLPGRSHDALKNRNWPELVVGPLDKAAQEECIVQYLKQYRKELTPAQRQRIIREPQASNPLYLRTLLEELRVFGIYEDLDRQIDHYLGAPAVESLFTLVLERLEKDYERDRPRLVRDLLSLVWASRRGVSETELLALLGTDESPMPRALFSSLYLALEESFASRSGLLTFFHDFLRAAVESRYLGDSHDRQKAHLAIADYFDSKMLDDRKEDELPWQLCQAENWPRLKDCITDMNTFPQMIRHEKQYEVMEYWHAMKDGYDIVEAYNDALEEYERRSPRGNDLAYRLNQTAFFFMSYGRYRAVESLFRKALDIRIEVLGPRHLYTAISYLNLGWLCETMGRYEDALSLYYRSYEIRIGVLGLQNSETVAVLYMLAGLYEHKGDYIAAEALYQRTLSAREELLGPKHAATAGSLHSLSWLYFCTGRYDEALSLCEKALSIRENALGAEHPAASWSRNNLSLIYRAMGDYDRAVSLIQTALRISERTCGPDHPEVATNLTNYGLVLIDKGDLDGAEPCLRRGLEIREKVFGTEHPDTATSLDNLGWLYEARGDYEDALRFYQGALDIRTRLQGAGHPQTIKTANSVFRIAGKLRDQGDIEKACQWYRKVLMMYQGVAEALQAPAVNVLQNMAVCHNEIAFHSEVPGGRWTAAAYHYRRAIELFNGVADRIGAANAEVNLQITYHLSGQQVDLERVKEVTRILEEAGSPRAEKGKRLLRELS